MRSLGILLIGEKYVRVTGFQLLDGGVKRRFNQSTPIRNDLIESVAEMMLAGEGIAHGEWLIVMPESLFSSHRSYNTSLEKLKIVISRIHIKTLSKHDLWDEVLDWTAVNFFSNQPVVIP